MPAVPARLPFTTPVVEPIDAVAGALLVHRPPDDASLNTIVEPVQTLFSPVMAAGNGLTVTGCVAIQPVASM